MAEQCSIQVAVRCRPLSRAEQERDEPAVVEADPSRGVVTIRGPRCYTFSFDHVFDGFATQHDVFDEAVKPIVNAALEGYNGAVFAYGQTGTGKAFTMQGYHEQVGIIDRSISHIFNHISKCPATKFLVHVTFIEISKIETIRDLLSQDTTIESWPIRESVDRGVFVKGLQKIISATEKNLRKTYKYGHANQYPKHGKTAATSQKHTIFTIVIEKCSPVDDVVRVGRLDFVTLCGSERHSKTYSEGMDISASVRVGLSLSALGNVICALVDSRATHIPYRDSCLTRLMTHALGGNAHTLWIATCGPAESQFDETISTLRYANRASLIQNRPVINENPKHSLLIEMMHQIDDLQRRLLSLPRSVAVEDDDEIPELIEVEDDCDADPSSASSVQRAQQSPTIEDGALSDRDAIVEEIAKLQSRIVVGGFCVD